VGGLFKEERVVLPPALLELCRKNGDLVMLGAWFWTSTSDLLFTVQVRIRTVMEQLTNGAVNGVGAFLEWCMWHSISDMPDQFKHLWAPLFYCALIG
jgi:hypothetical protein